MPHARFFTIWHEEETSPTLRAGTVPAVVALYENHSQDTRYTGKLFTALFQRCWKKANPGIPESELRHVRPYDLRHRFASVVLHNWIDEGKNPYSMLPYLSAYMGHSRISDTAYYIHILPENLMKSSGISWEEMDGIVPEVSIWED